jgi:hypothetical protein
MIDPSRAALQKLADYFKAWSVRVHRSVLNIDSYMVTFSGLSEGEVRMLIEAAKNWSGHETKLEPARH